MATIQQSIDIKVPVHTVYSQLTQFEEYPRFMEEVEAVRQIDDTHLHWTTVMSNRSVEWDAEITEQEPDRCIAWRNTSGPTNAGKVEMQPVGPGASRITLTLEAEQEQVPGSFAGGSAQEMAQRLKKDLARLKQLIETRGGQAAAEDQDAGKQRAAPAGHQQSLDFNASEQGCRTDSLQSRSGYAAGSEGFSGDEDASAPMTSAGAGISGSKLSRPANQSDASKLTRNNS